MDKIKLWKIQDNYVDYLREFDPINVKENKDEKRVYIGILININDVNYFAPLASPRTKHKDMKNQMDFHKINEGRHGVINFNNMIPVPDFALIDFDIALEHNKGLLYNQLKFLNDNAEVLLNKAYKVHELFFKADSDLTNFEKKVKSRCANFAVLEHKCRDMINYINEAAITTEDDEIEL